MCTNQSSISCAYCMGSGIVVTQFRRSSGSTFYWCLVYLSVLIWNPCRALARPGQRCTRCPTCCAVHEAVIWWVLHEHQLVLDVALKVLVGHHEAGPVLVHGHLHSCVVLLAEVVSGPPEVRHGQPAGSERAGAADPVALALQLHKALHCLQPRSEVTGYLAGEVGVIFFFVSKIDKRFFNF